MNGSVKASLAWSDFHFFCLIPCSFFLTRSMNKTFSSSVAHLAWTGVSGRRMRTMAEEQQSAFYSYASQWGTLQLTGGDE